MIAQIDALILCGGQGTRLRSVVNDRPKSLALINSKPFLDILIDDLVQQGLRRFIYCTGYMSNMLFEHISNRTHIECIFSNEEFPLGTGGAIVNALNLIKSKEFFVFNGDSWNDLSIDAMLEFHKTKKSKCTIALVNSENHSEVGHVQVDKNMKIQAFSEKSRNRSNLVNAGVYLFDLKTFSDKFTNQKIASLEEDFFPRLIQSHDCYGFQINNKLIDIGTPENYILAHRML